MHGTSAAGSLPGALASATPIGTGVAAAGPRRASLAAAGLAGAGVIAIVSAGVFQVVLQDAAPDLALTPVVLGVYVLAFASSAVVGTALIVRRAGHPVGWCYLALSTALAVGLLLDLYARFGALARPGSLPGAELAAHLADPIFVAYFASIALALQLTPSGTTLGPRWRAAAVGTVVAAATTYVCGLIGDQPIDAPFGEVPNPLAVPALGPATTVLWQVGATATALGLVAGGASLVVRYRRSGADVRNQLRWLTLAALPLPVFVAGAFIWRDANNDAAPLLIATAGWIVVVPVATWLCISRHHLFQLDGLLSQAATYLVVTGLVVATYAVVVAVVGEALGDASGESPTAVVLATLAAISLAGPARRLLQTSIDRRFRRGRYQALRVLDRGLEHTGAGRSIDDLLRDALHDPALVVGYWVDAQSQWVDAGGHPLSLHEEGVPIERAGTLIARVVPGGATVDLSTVEAVARRASTELDNARLRAEISRQLVEVEESRTRIATAQIAERRRIERDLHDGAQQRLLGLAFELRAAQLNGEPDRIRDAIEAAIGQTQAAVVELRELANGLNPTILADGGLAAAVDDLVSRSPGCSLGECTDRRFSPEIEAAAWFVIREGVTNALKHAGPASVTITALACEDTLEVRVSDDGCGGADARGGGLEGVRDRVEALGGDLRIESPPAAGTVMSARLPCER